MNLVLEDAYEVNMKTQARKSLGQFELSILFYFIFSLFFTLQGATEKNAVFIIFEEKKNIFW